MKYFTVILICFISINVYGQDKVTSKNESELDEMLSGLSTMYFTKVNMDIDLNVYEASDNGNIYGTSNKDSAIIAVVYPTSSFNEVYSEEADGAILIEKWNKTFDEKPIIFLKHKKKIEEKTYVRLVYYIEDSKDYSILISSFYELEKEDKYKNLIEKAALSAEIIE